LKPVVRPVELTVKRPAEVVEAVLLVNVARTPAVEAEDVTPTRVPV
jgi:hypothetical protein